MKTRTKRWMARCTVKLGSAAAVGLATAAAWGVFHGIRGTVAGDALAGLLRAAEDLVRMPFGADPMVVAVVYPAVALSLIALGVACHRRLCG